MSILKPIPLVPQLERALCPYCGKASFSRTGIHPQCALDQADAVRYAKVREKRKSQPKAAKPRRSQFSKNCPACGAHMHVRVKDCVCGHEFDSVQR